MRVCRNTAPGQQGMHRSWALWRMSLSTPGALGRPTFLRLQLKMTSQFHDGRRVWGQYFERPLSYVPLCNCNCTKSNLGTVISQSNQLATNRTKRQSTYQRYQGRFSGLWQGAPLLPNYYRGLIIESKLQILELPFLFWFCVLGWGVDGDWDRRGLDPCRVG